MSQGFTDLDDWYQAPLGSRYFLRCWEALEKLLKPAPGMRILDAGCGAGHYSEKLFQAGALVQGIDPNSKLVERAQQRVPSANFQVGSVENLPFGSQQFDCGICCNVLEFVIDPVQALTELRRVCQQSVVVIVLNDRSLWQMQQYLARPFTNHPYYRGHFFSQQRLFELATQAQWQVKMIAPLIHFPPLPFASWLAWAEGRFTNACWIAQLH
jgi:ubiquinone/menaquinone biosynthesis C-methylase UbiE